MKCEKCKSYDVMFDEKITPIVFSCNGCGHQWKEKSIDKTKERENDGCPYIT